VAAVITSEDVPHKTYGWGGDQLVLAEEKVFVGEDPERSVSIGQLVGKATFALGTTIVGRGAHMREPSAVDPETGETNPFPTLARTAVMAEVEVDTETGEVEVLQLVSAYDVGKAINPLLAEGRIDGGAVMGLGAALMENLHPYYPSLEWQPETLGDYVIPGPLDVPEVESAIYERPSLEGPYGAKGIGEMTANAPAPAIVNAVHDAIGVWVHELPMTPERVLRALAEQEAES
jgi:CO/xanthine dehydrogenase Mo-binding subunit